MYEPLLFIHSWTRWIVLASAVYLLALCVTGILRRQAWSEYHAHVVWAFNQVFLLQVSFGLVLWFAASPVTHAAFLHPSLVLETPLYEFWALRHPLTMIAALGVFHVGKARAKREPSPFKTLALTVATSLALIATAVPWPFLSYGRALFRGF